MNRGYRGLPARLRYSRGYYYRNNESARRLSPAEKNAAGFILERDGGGTAREVLDSQRNWQSYFNHTLVLIKISMEQMNARTRPGCAIETGYS